ncbi:MAG: fumarylacetoacetate hydrolase family protein [Chlorobium sp.]|jgi:2-keto-4-pentenoate hydratase/2-oxohepta-3-ene-1,7-dioic acid hydratase in catechol pathway|nr:fumarylacetoacetate hydrolase family protein [Chlorobium sp.]
MPQHIDPSSVTTGTVFCVAKNYPEHAREMLLWDDPTTEGTPLPDEEPVIFLKPASSISTDGITGIPSFNGKPVSGNLHYEAELILLIGRDCENCSLHEALQAVKGYGIGLDMTLRDVQLAAKKEGNPWLKSKGFRNSALISEIIPRAEAGNWQDLEFILEHNGKRVQHGKAASMIFSPIYLVHYLSYLYGLRRGDLVFTGTPSGVGRVVPGDHLKATLFHREILSDTDAAMLALKACVI